MKKEDKSKLMLICFFALIILIPLIWFPISHLLISSGKKTLTITDNWKYYRKTGNLYIDLVEGTKVSLENRVNNYFPFYSNLTNSYNLLNYNLNSLIEDNDAIIGKNSDGEFIRYNENNSFYYVSSKHSNQELENRYKDMVKFFNNLVNFKDVNLYLYTTLRYEMTSMSNRNLFRYVEMFKDELNEQIKFEYLDTNSVDKYLKYFYKTDHHWNAYGALEGYKALGKMMNFTPKDYEIKEMNIPYYGAFAKSVLSKSVADVFTVIYEDKKLNVFDISTCDQTMEYKSRKYDKSKNDFYDYYIGYYNGQFGHVSYKGNEKSKRNLLIFSDSIAWQIDYLITEHFNETHIINLRYNEFAGMDINYSYLVDDLKITDVLFLYEGATLIFDEFNHNMDERITRW